MYDIIIVGAGPAGLTAALYAKQARKKILVLEKNTYGGQILLADKVKNYPGFEEISGIDYATKLYNQVINNNVEIRIEEVVNIKNNNDNKTVITNKGEYECEAVIIASGAKNRKLNLPKEDEFIGKGVSYCATCDGMFFKNKTIAITGGGNSAIDSAIYLSDICKEVFLIYRNKEFKTTPINIDILKNKKNVKFIMNSVITKLNGNNLLESITIVNNESNKQNSIIIDGLFIEIGYIPVSNICNNIIETTSNGYIISNEKCQTNIDGIFAAGDIRDKQIRQLTTACSDGTIAALNACKYIANKKRL